MAGSRVAITGIGAITASGWGTGALWDSVVRGRSCVRRITRFDPAPFRSQLAAEVACFESADRSQGRRRPRMDRCSQLAVAATGQALADACFGRDCLRGTDTAIFVGSALGGTAFAEEQHERYMEDGLKAVSPTLALNVFAGACATNVAIEFGVRGPAMSNANSCAAGAVAIGEAFRHIRDGAGVIALAGGAESPLAPLTFGSFALIKAMSTQNDRPEEACRPFDRDRDGFVMGEGAGMIVVEAWEHARRRGARIYAEVLGYAMTNDAYHMTAPLPDGREAARAMSLALSDADLDPKHIGYVNAHATGTRLGDAAEAAALTAVFGRTTPPVSGTKAVYGHPLGASPAIEAAITALALTHGYAPATTNLSSVDADCEVTHVPGTGQRIAGAAAMTNAFGFGGINTALILGRAS